MEKPEVFVQLGHSGDIRSIAFSPDGKYILSGGGDKTLKLWEAATGKEITTLKGHSDSVDEAVFSSDGKFILSTEKAFTNRRLILWDFFTGKAVRDYKIIPSRSTFSSDGKYIVGGDENENVSLWDVATGQKIKTMKADGKPAPKIIEAIGISGDNKYAVSSHQPGILRIWDIAAGMLVKELKNPNFALSHHIAVSRTGRFFLSAGFGKDNKMTLLLWDMEKGQVIRTVFTCESGGSAFGIFSPDEKQILFSKVNSEKSEYFLCLADLKTSHEVWCTEGHSTYISSGAFAPDGKRVITGGTDHTLKLWDIATGKNIRTFTGNVTFYPFGYSAQKNLMLAGSSIRELSTGKITTAFNFQGAAVSYLMLSPDGRHVFTKEQKMLYNTETGNWTTVFPEENGYMRLNPVFSRDGRYILAAFEGTLKLWDIDNAKTVKIIKAHDAFPGIEAMAFSPDGRFILSGGTDNNQGTLKLWDVNSARNIWTVKLNNIRASSLDFSPDGKYILLGDSVNNMPVLYNAANGMQIKEFEHSDRYRSRWNCLVTFSPDGKTALSADWGDNRIVLWNVATGKEIKMFQGHSAGLYSLVFLQDGKRFLSWGYDGTTRLWDISTGREIVQFISFTDGEWIVITPEGYYNASANAEKHLNVRIGNHIYGIDNYREAFYRPDLVAVALSGGSLKDFRRMADVKQPPTVSIVDTPQGVAADTVTVKLRLADNGGGIGDIRLYLNGTAVVMDSRAVKVIPNVSAALMKEYTLKLAGGRNIIKAVAFNGDNSMQSNEATLEVTASFVSAGKPSLSALVIGINEFTNPKLKLNYTVADADLFAATLGQVSAGLFDKVNIRKLITRETTTNLNIIREIKTFQSLRPDDLFVFYIASHGTVDEGEYFLITSNVGSLRTEKLRTDAISQNMLKEAIANIPATKKLIIIDTCNAGALGDALQVAMMTRGMSEDTALKILSRAVGSTILSASTSVQEALEGYQGHGLFTYVLAEGLKGLADKGKTGYIKTTDLADYVDNEVPLLAEKVFKRAQYPTISISGQAFPIGRVQ